MSIGLVDTATREVHVFSLKRNGEVTIKEFITTVEGKLSELTETGTCIRILCAAVGDSCINICDRLRTVQYYLLDAKSWFVKTALFPSSYVDVHIKEINMEHGNEAAIKIDLDKSHVKDLKQKFARMTCTFFPNLHLVFGRKELENDKRLSDYNLTGGCVVPCMSGDRRLRFGTPYMHIPQRHLLQNSHDSQESVEISRHPPVWRRATPGLWLEGKCCNEICVAYSKFVVMNQGFTDLDYMNEKHKYKCPMCYEQVTPVAYGVNRCEWTTVCLRKTTSECSYPPQVVRQDWQRLEEGFSCFIPNKDSWLMFKITSRDLNHRSKFCVLCMSSVACEMVKALCGHMFHAGCLKADMDCLQCIGEQSMTVYQKYFQN